MRKDKDDGQLFGILGECLWRGNVRRGEVFGGLTGEATKKKAGRGRGLRKVRTAS